MNQHFRTAVLTVILAGGTLASYGAAYATMAKPVVIAAADARPAAVATKRMAPGQTDVSVREVCSSSDRAGERTRCLQTMSAAARPVRVIDLVETHSSAARG